VRAGLPGWHSPHPVGPAALGCEAPTKQMQRKHEERAEQRDRKPTETVLLNVQHGRGHLQLGIFSDSLGIFSNGSAVGF